MRVIAGTLGGRHFDSPKKQSTHPMSEKMRGALFSALGDIQGLTVLDAYSGSGALAIEAFSRGAKHIVAIDMDKGSVATIRANLDLLRISAQSCKVIQSRIESWLNTSSDKFDLIFGDPPYDDADGAVFEKLIKRLNPGGLLVLSWPGKLQLPEIGKVVHSLDYGDSQLGFFSPS